MPIVVGVALLILAVAVYLRHLREAGWLLLALRLVIVLLFAGILLDWVFARYWSVSPRKVAMLLDRSLSMSVGGADTLALRALERFPVPEGVRQEYWGVGDTAGRIANSELQMTDRGDQEMHGRRTRLGAALKTVFKTEPGAVVLFSDGQDNGDADPIAAARESGIPVNTVGCGVTGERNVGVVSLTVPPDVYAGDTITAVARVRYSGFRDEEAVVRLAGRVRQLVLADEAAEQDISFSLSFEKPGRQLLKVAVESMPGEAGYTDNEAEAGVEVLPGRTAVAYLTNRPGPNTRFITNVLNREPRVQLREAVQATPGTPQPDYGDADVYVLDGMYEVGTSAALSDIAQKVRQGAGALILAGPEFRPGQALAELLPGETGVRIKQGSFVPVLTSAGRVFSWLGEIRFDKVPPFTVLHQSEPDEDAEAWVVAGEPAVPLMESYQVGKGRVVYVAGHPLWRWGFGPEIGPGQNPLESFLTGVVRYLAEQDREPFRLSSDRPAFNLGEPVRLTLVARAPDGSAWTGLDAVVEVDSGPAAPMVERTPGVYRAELSAVRSGQHRVSAQVKLADSVLGRTDAEFVVSEREIELVSTGLNRRLLSSISEASGGEYFRWDSLPAEGFEPVLAVFKRGFRFEPRRNAWVYALIALLVGAELVLRRRRGLL